MSDFNGMEYFSKQSSEKNLSSSLKEKYRIVLFDTKSGEIFFAIKHDSSAVAVEEFQEYGPTLYGLAESLEEDKSYSVGLIHN